MDLKGSFLDFSQSNAALHNLKIAHSSDNFKRNVAAPQHLLRRSFLCAVAPGTRDRNAVLWLGPVKIAA